MASPRKTLLKVVSQLKNWQESGGPVQTTGFHPLDEAVIELQRELGGTLPPTAEANWKWLKANPNNKPHAEALLDWAERQLG